MLNSPSMCLAFVNMPLQEVKEKFPQGLAYHYMDDILFRLEKEELLENIFSFGKTALEKYRLEIAPERIQDSIPYQYLGYKILQQKITPQKIGIRQDALNTFMIFKI